MDQLQEIVAKALAAINACDDEVKKVILLNR